MLTVSRPAAAAVLMVLCAGAADAGQVALPAEGEGAVSVTYQGLASRDHLDSNGRPYDKGRISNLALVATAEYGLTDRFTFDGNVALVASRHRGADRLHGPLDTGIYHGTVQDARLALRFGMAFPRGFIAAPFIGAIVPTHNYEFRGHSAPGRRNKALQLGGGVGRGLGPLLPAAYVQGLYSFSLVERVEGMSVNRSNLDVEVGYAVAPAVTLMVTGALQRTHGGLSFPLSRHYEGQQLADISPFHDRVARANHFLMSSGATVSINRRLAAYGSVIWTVAGQNTHSVKGFALGGSWAFSRGLTLGGTGSGTSAARATRLERSQSIRRAAEFGM